MAAVPLDAGPDGFAAIMIAWGLSWKKGGMGSSIAQNNYKLLLKIVHWLDGLYN